MRRRRLSWPGIVLGLLPALIALLWVGGTANLHGRALAGRDWAVLVAAAVALQLVVRRALRPRPLPPLPPNVRPAVVAALAAGVFALLAAVFGAAIEFAIAAQFPDMASPWLCAVWHGACAGGASYVSLLPRLLAAAAARPLTR